MRRVEILGAVFAGSAIVMLGSSFTASNLIADYPPLLSQAVRYLLAALFLAGLLRRRGESLPRITRRDGALLLALALTGLIGFNLCLLAALRRADPAAVGVIVGCTPIVLAFAGPILQRRAIQRRLVGAAIVVTAGAAIVQGSGTMTPGGLALSLGALLGEAAFSLIAAPLLPRLGPLAVSTYVCAIAGVLLACGAFTIEGSHGLPATSPEQVAAIVYLASAVTAGGFMLWYSGLARLGVERAGLFAGLLPISALLTAAIAGSATVTLARLAGAVLVGVGVATGVTAKGERSRPGRARRRAIVESPS